MSITRKTGSKATSTAEKIEHTFPDGTKFTGTFEQLQKVADTLGMKITGIGKVPKGYYLSKRGLVKISEMNDYHIRRSLLKRSKDYFSNIFDKNDTNRQFLKKYNGLIEDSVVVELYNELSKRV